MSDSSLETYWGGLLLNSCSPLELRLNWCSHACGYCFANLNRPDRAANIKQVTNLLSELWHHNDDGSWKRTSYTAHLLRSGYAVTISNHVDPLAASNAFQALPLIEMLIAMDIPLNLMTKFGKPKDSERLLEMLSDRPTPFYVSLSTLDPDLTRKCEPGAPTPAQRLHWIKEAIAQGHQVNVGINPIIPGWIDDPDYLAKTLKAIGVWGVVLGKVHLSQNQLKNMPERDREALGEEVITAAGRSNTNPAIAELYDAVEQACEDAGLEIYTSQQGRRSDVFRWEKALNPVHFPLMQDFVNNCHDTKESGDLIYWSEFRDFFVPKLPKGEYGLRDHLNALAIQETLYGKQIPQRMSYLKLLWYCWQFKETIVSPANADCFAYAGDRLDDKGHNWTQIVDDELLPILIFLPEGTDGYAYSDRHFL